MERFRPKRTLSLLLAGDDPRRMAHIGAHLESHGCTGTVQAALGDVARGALRAQPDAVVLDLGLRLADAQAICREMRAAYANPIIVLVDGTGEEEHLTALLAGADDVLPRRVHPKALLGRIQARLRRLGQPWVDLTRVELPQIVVDAGRRAARVRGRWIDLTDAEFEVLWFLARRAGHTVSRGEICARLRGFPYDGLDRTIDLRVARLRSKLGDDGRHPKLIKSVRGEGYMLVREA